MEPTLTTSSPDAAPGASTNALTGTSTDACQPLDLRGQRLHFVGIGGCGMSGLARICRDLGAICTGSDRGRSPITDHLESLDVAVQFEQTAASVPNDCDAVVCSAAIPDDHPERTEANRRKIPVMKYAQLLGRLMIGRTGVAIAGTHGKSTTTSMLAHVAIQTGLDPSFIVGATCEQIGGGARVGSHDLLIAEACEYDRSFHNFHPTHSVILNVEADHLDVYGTLDAVVESFNQFARRTAKHGSLLIGHECAHRVAVGAGVEAKVETIGFSPEADWVIHTEERAIDPTLTSDSNAVDPPGAQRVTISRDDRTVVSFDLAIPGEHMAYNAAVAVVTAHRLGAEANAAAEAISTFRGLDRRMQFVGLTPAGARVIDDYGHHPTEITATLRALRTHHLPPRNTDNQRAAKHRHGRLICVFQPHQHSRTRFLLDQFASSFADADVVVVPDIYFVRDSEADRRAVSSADLVRALVADGVDAHHIPEFDAITDFLADEARSGDLIVVMGAGPVWRIAHGLI